MYDTAFMEFLKTETRLAYFFANHKESIPIVVRTYSAVKHSIYTTVGSAKFWEEPTREKMIDVGRQLFKQNQDLMIAAFLTGHTIADTPEGKAEYITVTGMTIDGRKVLTSFNAKRNEKNQLELDKAVNFSYKPSVLERIGSAEQLSWLIDGYLDEYHIEK